MTLECVHNNNIAVLWYNYVVGPMARPGARGLGPGLGLNYDNCVAGRAGPGHSFCGPGPGLIIHKRWQKLNDFHDTGLNNVY